VICFAVPVLGSRIYSYHWLRGVLGLASQTDSNINVTQPLFSSETIRIYIKELLIGKDMKTCQKSQKNVKKVIFLNRVF